MSKAMKTGNGKNKKIPSKIAKLTKKQLQAKVASLQKTDDKSSGEEDSDGDNEPSSSFTLAQVKAFITAAATSGTDSETTKQHNKKRKDNDSYESAALHLQQVLKRTKQQK